MKRLKEVLCAVKNILDSVRDLPITKLEALSRILQNIVMLMLMLICFTFYVVAV